MAVSPIFIEGLSKTYRSKKGKRIQALSNLSLAIKPGEVFGFLGPNGAGKSTTIKALMGLVQPTSGKACLFDLPVNNPASRKRVGYLPENPAFYDFLTAREYLRFVGASFGLSREIVSKKAAEVLALLNLQAAADRPIRSYSKGMVQRLGLAQTLLHDPDLYLLDEPMSGLDPIGRALVKQIILDLKSRGKTIFFSTHVTADAERVCDRIGVIVDGVFQEARIVDDLLREGVEGYFCRVRGLSVEVFNSFEIISTNGDLSEIFVPRLRFDTFAEDILAYGGSFDLIEPHRRDMEEYFLSLVQSAKGGSCD